MEPGQTIRNPLVPVVVCAVVDVLQAASAQARLHRVAQWYVGADWVLAALVDVLIVVPQV